MLEGLVIYGDFKCDTGPSVRYLMREEKGKVWRGFVKSLLESKAKPPPPKNL